MKRDLDHIRRILLEVEAAPLGEPIMLNEQADAFQAAFALDANLVDGIVETDNGNIPYFAALFRLTWEGADFLDATRDDTLWAKARKEVISQGKAITFATLKGWLQLHINQTLGI